MAKPDPAALRALFDQAPKTAIEYLASKGLRISFDWREMRDEAHARAFTVAKAMQLDVLRDIRTALLDALREGKTLRQFESELTPLLQAKGWWGKQIVVNSQGEAEQVQLGSPQRLKTIYQTNLQSAYMAGRTLAQQQASSFPYLMYVAVMDSRTRPSHAALNGKIWRKDDPIWQFLMPPNGFNCRCRTRALTEGQMRREGLTVSPPAELLTRVIDNDDDALFPTTQHGVRTTDAKGRPLTMWVDQSFNSSPLAGHAFDELLARKAVAALGDAAGFEQVRQLVLSETRMKAWDAFVDNAVNSGVRNQQGLAAIQGQTMTTGVIPLNAARALSDAGSPFVPVLHVADRLVIGRKALRHAAAGNALTLEQWQRLPQMLERATWYFEPGSGHLIAVMDSGIPDAIIKAAFTPDGSAATVFVVPSISVVASVDGGMWRLLQHEEAPDNGRGT